MQALFRVNSVLPNRSTITTRTPSKEEFIKTSLGSLSSEHEPIGESVYASDSSAVNHLPSGINKVHAVIGGFHLAPYKEDYVRDTVAAMKDMDIDYIIPLHCTGEPFYDMVKAEMPNKLLRSYTGTRFVFSA